MLWWFGRACLYCMWGMADRVCLDGLAGRVWGMADRVCLDGLAGRVCTWGVGRACLYAAFGRACLYMALGRACLYVGFGRPCLFGRQTDDINI